MFWVKVESAGWKDIFFTMGLIRMFTMVMCIETLQEGHLVFGGSQTYWAMQPLISRTFYKHIWTSSDAAEQSRKLLWSRDAWSVQRCPRVTVNVMVMLRRNELGSFHTFQYVQNWESRLYFGNNLENHFLTWEGQHFRTDILHFPTLLYRELTRWCACPCLRGGRWVSRSEHAQGR